MIEKIVTGNYLTKLDNIIQWQECDVHQRESVSQHSYKVVIFTRVLLEGIFPNNTEKVLDFKLRVVDYAMFHDWDEALINRDIAHSTKYNSYNGNEIREVLNQLIYHLANQYFPPTKEDSKLINSNIVEPGKDVHDFVKVADWMAMLYFCIREVKLGNKAFHKKMMYISNGLSKAIEVVIKMINDEFKGEEFNLAPLYKLIEYFELPFIPEK